MVRLESNYTKNMTAWITNFNSSMVRLEYNLYKGLQHSYMLFQFLNGAIRMPKFEVMFHVLFYFNSSMVRLELDCVS